MAYVAALRFHDRKVSYFILDEHNYSASKIETVNARNDQEAYEAINNFRMALVDRNEPGTVEYHIGTMHGPYEADALTQYVYKQFHQAISSVPRTEIESQCRGELKNPELKSFKAALQDLGLASKAIQWHLWTVALHATKSTVEDKIKDLWFKTQQASLTKQDDVTLYEAWRENLGS